MVLWTGSTAMVHGVHELHKTPTVTIMIGGSNLIKQKGIQGSNLDRRSCIGRL
jgi:hypothetical protein